MEFLKHGMICLHCNKKVTMIETQKIQTTEIRLLLFGQLWVSFDNTFVVIYIQIKEITKNSKLSSISIDYNIGKSMMISSTTCTHRIVHNELLPFRNMRATKRWHKESWRIFISFYYIKIFINNWWCYRWKFIW